MASCSICIEDISCMLGKNTRVILPNKTNCFILKCNHIFHKACIKRWFYENGITTTCPMCRSNFHLKCKKNMHDMMIDLWYMDEEEEEEYFYSWIMIEYLVFGFMIKHVEIQRIHPCSYCFTPPCTFLL
jgi:hypothetical protein